MGIFGGRSATFEGRRLPDWSVDAIESQSSHATSPPDLGDYMAAATSAAGRSEADVDQFRMLNGLMAVVTAQTRAYAEKSGKFGRVDLDAIESSLLGRADFDTRMMFDYLTYFGPVGIAMNNGLTEMLEGFFPDVVDMVRRGEFDRRVPDELRRVLIERGWKEENSLMLGTVSDGGTELKAVIIPNGNGTVTFCGDIGGSVVGGLPLHLRQFSADPFNVDVAGARVYLTRDISLVPSPGIEVIDEAGVQFVQRTLQAWAREATEVAPPPADLGTPPDPLSIARPALRPGANSPMPAAARYSVQVQTAFGAVDVLALCVRADGSADGDDGVALWTKPQCACGAVRIDPAARSVDIRVDDLPADVVRVIVVAQADVPGGVSAVGRVTAVISADGSAVLDAIIETAPSLPTLQVAEIYRHGRGLKARCLGDGYADGLQRLLEVHGIRVV